MIVNAPSVGPILGATTPQALRLFVRGEYTPDEKGRPRRAHGVARLRKAGRGAWTTKYFKLNPNFDLTGIVEFDNLSPTTRYTYQAGWIYSELDSDNVDIGPLLEWDDTPETEVVTASASPNEKRSFIVGSCRYLLRLFGGSWFDDRGDKVFRSIARQVDAGAQTDLLLMVGDQIYADDLNFLSPDSRIDQFNARYRDAFGQEHLRGLMARVPTYMTLDDHEIEDNWPAKADPADLTKKFPAAIHAYLTYQLSHSPLFSMAGGRLSGTPDRLWYTHSDGCADFFVMDTRTERRLSVESAQSSNQIIGEEQMRALKRWLNDGSGRVKFVASAVPLFAATGDDKWEGFVRQRDEILDHIMGKQLRKVVFLSGDVHASFSCELTSQNDANFKVISVVSSAFFWPYPHPARSSFQLSGALTSTSANKYTVGNASKVHPKDNFTRVTVDSTKIGVEFFERKGKRLGNTKSHVF